MSWYDFGHHEPELTAYLPDGKNVIDTGFYYQELMALGGWYFHPIPGSGQRRFYNRVYINPSKKEIDLFNLDERARVFINLSSSNFGKLEIKIDKNGYYYIPSGFRQLWTLSDDEIAKIVDNWTIFYDYKAKQIVKSFCVLYPESQHDNACIFNNYQDALRFAESVALGLSKHMLDKYGVQIYKPHSEQPFMEICKVV